MEAVLQLVSEDPAWRDRRKPVQVVPADPAPQELRKTDH